MSNETNTQTWTSGDWKKRSRTKPPYNGIKIQTKTVYDNEDKFSSVSVSFIDFTNNVNGVSSIIPELTLEEGWANIPKATISSPPSSPPSGLSAFTVNGKVKLSEELSGIYLRIHLYYGVEHAQREEIGYIIKFNPIKTT